MPPLEEPEFIRLQRQFTRHLRSPQTVPAPAGHEARRLAIYTNAVFSNVEGLLAGNYPRIKGLMPADEWQEMVRDYVIRHRSEASAFIDVTREFLKYLESERVIDGRWPFLCELAHFDWLETCVGADERRLDFSGVSRDGDLMEGVPVANPIMQMVEYRFPVHAINAEYRPQQAPALMTQIAAFRDPQNLYGFLDLNAATAALLKSVINNKTDSGKALVERMADEMQDHDQQAIRAAGIQILERMHKRGVILGCRC
jgi:hypothetical protein